MTTMLHAFQRGWRVVALPATGAALLFGLQAQPQALAQVVPQLREQIRLSFAPVVKRTASAVVNVYTKAVLRQHSSPLLRDPFFRRFFSDNARRRAPRERVQSSLGRGVIVDPSGLIITNFPVACGAGEITAVLADDREFLAKIVLAEERTDLVVLQIATKSEALPFLPLRDSDDFEVGDLVLAICNPFGVGQTVTSGIVSALAGTSGGISDYSFFIQANAAINRDNSGGAPWPVAVGRRHVGQRRRCRIGGGSATLLFALQQLLALARLHPARRSGHDPRGRQIYKGRRG